EREGTDGGSVGELEDFLVLSADGVDLRSQQPNAVFVDGNRVMVTLNNVAGDVGEPIFAILDDFNQSFLADLQAAGLTANQATGLLSNLGGLLAQNQAGQSGFVRIRDTDQNQVDGRLTGV